MVSAKIGNYLAYFPSYQYLQMEAETFSKLYPQVELLLQSPEMDDSQREQFLRRFDNPHPDAPLLAFAVLGGIYSEGVDLKGEKLLGSAIIGTRPAKMVGRSRRFCATTTRRRTRWATILPTATPA